uniref:aspartyl/asparaginyl beta-hydroxylase domain-containing protein n=1 Tax=Altererythrobacter segetis TaxID=1104773 RepID=UPI00140BE6DD|nr:aspartyl/asparaginyl beta-hydroxylase domain-containing protein [Altererythrobacter segetis]
MQDLAISPRGGERAAAPKAKITNTRAVRIGKRLRDPVNRWIARQSLIGDEPFVDPAVIPGLAELGENWREIRDELVPLLTERNAIPALGEISPDHKAIARDGHWKSFFFTGYGFRAACNHARCPTTSALLEKVPGLVVAFFSIMEPGTHVPPHRGVTKAWLNCHLGMVVPDGPGRCAMEVAGQSIEWREGEWLVFDETHRHEVWNERQSPRVVLFLQVRRPMRLAGRMAASLLIRAIRRTSFVQDIRRNLGAR